MTRPSFLPIVALLSLPVAGTPSSVHAGAPAAPGNGDAARLLAAFAKVEGLSARYQEEKHMALLAEPLVAEGELYYARPGRLVRRQLAPEPATVLLTGETLKVADASGTQAVDLRGRPVVRAFADSIRAVLAGDAQRLGRLFVVRVHPGEGDRYRIVLVPRAAPLARILDRIAIEGHGIVLETMRIVERGGDETRIRFFDVNPRRRFRRDEIERLFRLP